MQTCIIKIHFVMLPHCKTEKNVIIILSAIYSAENCLGLNTHISPMQPLSVSKATTSTRSVMPWVRTCSMLWRRMTVWIDSVVVPCAPSPSTSLTTLDKRSLLSPGLLSACLASSPVVYKRWVKPLSGSPTLCPLNESARVVFCLPYLLLFWCCLLVHTIL